MNATIMMVFIIYAISIYFFISLLINTAWQGCLDAKKSGKTSLKAVFSLVAAIMMLVIFIANIFYLFYVNATLTKWP